MKTWEKLSLIIYVMYGNPLFPTYCREALWATRPQVTKVAMLGYNFIPSWVKNFVPTWHKVKNVGNRKMRITST
ncbi:MAG: hypothetical protein SOX46_12155 [Clostridiaceae bacterium]|uniref:hypothetical protein n=1 Tax=Clostridium sp. TaxID=1506 RepID=UPI00258F0F65|nr:hypothetical protein [Clostridium sp.]MDY3232303.1 hypothetical protein [Clostridiaceae bacterium]